MAICHDGGADLWRPATDVGQASRDPLQIRPRHPENKSFLVLFFKKEHAFFSFRSKSQNTPHPKGGWQGAFK
jgi:hypothetical protein